MTTKLLTLLTIKQASKELGISKCSMYRWVKRGWIGYVRLPNGSIRILQISISKVLAGKRI